MSKVYFIEENGKKCGPLTIQELKEKKIVESTLVWTEGMTEWREAQSILELNELIAVTPPPLPRKATPTPYINQTYFGLILAVLSLIAVYLIGTIKAPVSTNAMAVFVIVSIVIRILVASVCSDLAKKQNRDTTAWSLFGFFSPVLALIIQGLLKKVN